MIQAVCWVLIHSLWQGTLLALAAGLLIASSKWSSPALRYRILCGLLVLFLAGIGATFYYEWSVTAVTPGDSGGGGGIAASRMSDWCSAHAIEIVAVWLILAILKSVWMAAGWTYMRRIRRAGLRSGAVLADRVNELARQLGIRRTVKLVENALVRVPMVIGHLRPVIFIPLGLINHLPAGEMEAVLMHELAHIRRYDHVVNLIQQLAECALFFNPGFLWVSSLMRQERENCCDDIAIAHTHDRVEYVRALVRFKEYSLRGTALAFPGDKRQLFHRVVRISRLENKTLDRRQRIVLLACTLLLLSLLAIRADKPDMRKMETANAVALAAARRAAGQPGTPAPGQLMSVLQERQDVAERMEWVQSQLDNLRRQGAAGKKGVKPRSGQPGMEGDAKPLARSDANLLAQLEQQQKLRISGEQVVEWNNERQTIDLALNSWQQAERDRQQAIMNRMRADRSREQADRTGEQADLERMQRQRNEIELRLNREQADRDRELAEVQRQQAQRDREQALKDKLEADRDRQQAVRNREKAAMDRQQAEIERLQAVRNREQEERNRQQAERDRQQAERDRQEQIRVQAEKNRLADGLNKSN